MRPLPPQRLTRSIQYRIQYALSAVQRSPPPCSIHIEISESAWLKAVRDPPLRGLSLIGVTISEATTTTFSPFHPNLYPYLSLIPVRHTLRSRGRPAVRGCKSRLPLSGSRHLGTLAPSEDWCHARRLIKCRYVPATSATLDPPMATYEIGLSHASTTACDCTTRLFASTITTTSEGINTNADFHRVHGVAHPVETHLRALFFIKTLGKRGDVCHPSISVVGGRSKNVHSHGRIIGCHLEIAAVAVSVYLGVGLGPAALSGARHNPEVASLSARPRPLP
ncbi:hypothetical protein LIA77_01110 [Sarocladium implicatum]|nr:hypothetical protein LIA77_01110 [Sarocladium implicatum]